MSSLVWVIAVVVGLAILWFLFKLLLGFAVPPETSGKAYLRKQLKEIGIGNDLVSDECIEELVRIAIKTANLRKGIMGKNFINSFVESLDVTADTIHTWIYTPNDIMFKSIAGEEDIYRDIFERYKVPTKK